MCTRLVHVVDRDVRHVADVVLPLESVGRPFQRLFRTAEDLTVIRDAGHFLQEDQGDQVGQVIGDWLTRQQR